MSKKWISLYDEELIRSKKITPYEKLFILNLKTYIRDKNSAFPTIEQMALDIGVAEKTIDRIVKSLLVKKVISKKSEKTDTYKHNIYTLSNEYLDSSYSFNCGSQSPIVSKTEGLIVQNCGSQSPNKNTELRITEEENNSNLTDKENAISYTKYVLRISEDTSSNLYSLVNSDTEEISKAYQEFKNTICIENKAFQDYFDTFGIIGMIVLPDYLTDGRNWGNLTKGNKFQINDLYAFTKIEWRKQGIEKLIREYKNPQNKINGQYLFMDEFNEYVNECKYTPSSPSRGLGVVYA